LEDNIRKLIIPATELIGIVKDISEEWLGKNDNLYRKSISTLSLLKNIEKLIGFKEDISETPLKQIKIDYDNK